MDGSSDAFADAKDISAWALKAVVACREWGLVDGYTDETFRPQNGSTRAEVAAVISKLAWLVEELGGSPGRRPSQDDDDQEEVVTYDITFDYDIAGVADFVLEDVEEGDTYTLLTTVPEKEGYVFAGTWLCGEGDLHLAGEEMEADHDETYVAQWVDARDYIGLAVKETIEIVNDAYVEYGTQSVKGHTVTTLDKVVFNGGDVATPKAPREQSVYATVTGSDALVIDIVTAASNYAYALLTPVEVNKAELKEDAYTFVEDVIEKVEARLPIEFDEVTVQGIKDTVYETAVAAGKSVWAPFYDEAGKYYTSDITVSADDASVVIDVNEDLNKTSMAGTGRRAKVKALALVAAEVARDMYGELVTETRYTSAVELKGTLNIEFTDGEYAADTKNFAHEYPVTLYLTLNSNGVVDYKYQDGESYVRLNVSEDMQELYSEEIEKAAKELLGTQAVIDRIDNAIAGAMDQIDLSTYVDALVAVGYTQADAELKIYGDEDTDGVVDKWLADNTADGDYAESRLYKTYFLEEGKLDNEELYDLVDDIAEKAGDMIPDAFVSMMDSPSCTPETVEDLLDTLAAPPYNVDTFDLSALDAYPATKAYVLAKVIDNAKPGTSTGYAADMKAEIDDMIDDKLMNAEFKGYTVATALEKALNVKTVKDMADVRLGNLATALETKTFQKYAVKSEGFLHYIVTLAKYIPAKASVEIAGVEINEALLSDIRDAADEKDSAKLCDKVAELLRKGDLADLSLEEFYGEGQEITAKWGTRTFTMHAVVRVK